MHKEKYSKNRKILPVVEVHYIFVFLKIFIENSSG
jgi:hypothetical protein